MQNITDDQIRSDFKIESIGPASDEEVMQIRQSLTEAVAVRLAGEGLSAEQLAYLESISTDDPERVYQWLISQGLDVEPVYVAAYDELLNSFNLLSD